MKPIYSALSLLLLSCVKPIVALAPRATLAQPSITTDVARQTPTPMITNLAKRCNPNESCSGVTAGPEVPIAVTTTMMTTKIVPCTTTTTVINSVTSTLTLWSTSVQTETVSIKGAQTVTVWLITPAPEIIASTYSTDEVLTFTKERMVTTFWTSTAPVQTMTSTVNGGESTWTIAGQTSIVPAPAPPAPAPSNCQTCTQVASGIAPAWTQTTAGGPAPSSPVWAPPPPPPPSSSTSLTGVAPGAFGTISNTIPFGATSTVQSAPPGSPSITGTIYANQGSPFVANDGVIDIRPKIEAVAVAGAVVWFALG